MDYSLFLDLQDQAASEKFAKSGDIKDLAVISENLFFRRRIANSAARSAAIDEANRELAASQVRYDAQMDADMAVIRSRPPVDVPQDDFSKKSNIDAFFDK
jgi:hypothetical protein